MHVIKWALPIVVWLVVVSSAQTEVPELITTIYCDTFHTLFGYQIEPIGDQTDDGYDDFLTYDIRGRVFLYLGGNPPDSEPAVVFHNVRSRFGTVGDIDGDFIVDYAIPVNSPPGQVRMAMYLGGLPLDTVSDFLFGVDSLFGRGDVIIGHDINSNGTDELITWDHPDLGGRCLIWYELGSDFDSIPDLCLTPTDTPGPAYVFGDAFISGHFNGDEYYDLAVNFRPDQQYELNGMVYLYWGGPGFDTIPDMVIRHPGEWQEGYENFGIELRYLEDINGDGCDDFWVSTRGYDHSRFVYFGGPNMDTVPDIRIAETNRCQKARLAGDVNDDGYPDLITGFHTSYSLGWVRIYYGGPTMDSIADVYISTWDIPGSQSYFAHEIAGIGDYNGDGIDDFAIASYGQGWDQVIYVFAGWSETTDVTYDYEPTLPEGYYLSQNYPNPFNPSTIIEFDLPRRTRVTLSISNVLGQDVVTMVNDDLSAGTYSIVWDGKNDSGEAVASGIYIYKLSSDTFTQSRKMLLLK